MTDSKDETLPQRHATDGEEQNGSPLPLSPNDNPLPSNEYLPTSPIMAGAEDEVDGGSLPLRPPLDKTQLPGEPTQEIAIVKLDTYGADPPTNLDLNTVNEGPFDDRTANMRKAEHSAHAYKKATGGFVNYVSEHEGTVTNNGNLERLGVNASEAEDDRYEIESLAQRVGISPERIIEMIRDDLRASLEYGRSIIEHQQAFGEKLTPNQEVFLLICQLAEKYLESARPGDVDGIRPDILAIDKAGRRIRISGSDVGFMVNNSELKVEVTSSNGENTDKETWTATPFKISGPKSRLTAHVGRYTLEEKIIGGRSRFQEITRTSRKSIDELDVDALKAVFEQDEDIKAEQA